MKKSDVLFHIFFWLLIVAFGVLFYWGIYTHKLGLAIVGAVFSLLFFCSWSLGVLLKEYWERNRLSNFVLNISNAIESGNEERLLKALNALEKEPLENFSKVNRQNLMLLKNVFGITLPQVLVGFAEQDEQYTKFSKLSYFLSK